MEKARAYEDLVERLRLRLAGETDFTARAANTVALIYHSLPDINWAGLYLLKDLDLVLGPFQGLPARSRIPIGSGLVGRAARERATVVAADVHECPEHIACDEASNAEIVVPIVRRGELVGVLDVDSPVADRFDGGDEAGLKRVVEVLLEVPA
jgi:GAF domain-containing protein